MAKKVIGRENRRGIEGKGLIQYQGEKMMTDLLLG